MDKDVPIQDKEQYIGMLTTQPGFDDDGQWLRPMYSKSTGIAAQQTAKPLDIPTVYEDYRDVFKKKAFDKLPERRTWDHAIEIDENAQYDRRLKGKVYALSTKEHAKLDEFLDKNLASGRIRPSNSPIAALLFFVGKKDGDLRAVQDYRWLNTRTCKDSWPLPLILDVITRIKDAKIFSKFDVRWGFNNVRIREGDEWKADFITERGCFEPLVMFSGLTNSPATFQHMMDDIFSDLIRSQKLIAYMDDILIYSNDLGEHQHTVREVLKRIRGHKLYLKGEKCFFEKSEIDFLGMIIRNGTVSMDPAKVRDVKDWPKPKMLTEVRSFMQFCNFYRTLIPNFADITVPFNELAKKNAPFVWTERQEQAFKTLKDRVINGVTLLLPIDGAKFRLEADASDYATGAVLHQIVDNKAKPLGFFSKTLQEAERNYQIYDKEMLAIMLALAHWRHFLA